VSPAGVQFTSLNLDYNLVFGEEQEVVVTILQTSCARIFYLNIVSVATSGGDKFGINYKQAVGNISPNPSIRGECMT